MINPKDMCFIQIIIDTSQQKSNSFGHIKVKNLKMEYLAEPPKKENPIQIIYLYHTHPQNKTPKNINFP